MKDQNGRNDSLRQIVDILTNSASSGHSDTRVEKSGLNRTQAYRRRWAPENPGSPVEEAISLFISAGSDPRPLRFIGQVEEILHAHDTYGTIVNMAPFCGGRVVISIMARPVKINNLIDKLQSMPEVEKVDVEPLADDAVPDLPRKFGFLARLGASPSKKVSVILREPVPAERKLEPVPVLA
jgi:hypothetical protein